MWKSIRKFGLKDCDFPTMLSNVSAMLRILTINIDGRNNKRIPIVFKILTAVLSILYIYAYVLSSFRFAFWYIQDLTAAVISFSLTITSGMAVIRLSYMMIYREQLKELMNKYLAYDGRIVQGSRYASNMLKNLRYLKRRGIVYWLIIMVDCVVYVTKPLVTPGRHLHLDSYIIYGLEPMLESPNFEIASIILTICVTFICYTMTSVTCFLILTIGYNEAQMLSLSEEIRHLWEDCKNNENQKLRHEDADQNYNKNITEDEILNAYYVKHHLVDIINKHATTINNLNGIEEIMRGLNTIDFFLLTIGLIAELLGGLEQTWLQLPFTLLQLGVNCYLGQKILDSNEAFERAVYDCKWEMFNASNRKIVLIMLQNSQKTMPLSAGGVATLSFSCFLSIVNGVYSAYTTFRSIV